VNIIGQAAKLGITNFSVISSIGAVWDRNNIKPLYTSDGMILPNRRTSMETDFAPLERLEPDYKRTNSLRNSRAIECIFRHKDFRRTCSLGIRC